MKFLRVAVGFRRVQKKTLLNCTCIFGNKTYMEAVSIDWIVFRMRWYIFIDDPAKICIMLVSLFSTVHVFVVLTANKVSPGQNRGLPTQEVSRALLACHTAHNTHV